VEAWPDLGAGHIAPGMRSVRLSIHDLSGRLVRRLDPAECPDGGFGAVAWDGLDDAGARAVCGTYFVRLEADGVLATRKLTVLR